MSHTFHTNTDYVSWCDVYYFALFISVESKNKIIAFGWFDVIKLYKV